MLTLKPFTEEGYMHLQMYAWNQIGRVKLHSNLKEALSSLK